MKELVLEVASYAISAHNSQPFKFKFLSDTQFEIHVDPKRFLPVADPHSKDIQMSFGALHETLELGLSSKGLTLQFVSKDPEGSCWGHGEILVGSKKRSEFTLHDLEQRFSYRGSFSKSANEAWKMMNKISETINVSPMARFIMDPGVQRQIATLYDQVNLHFMGSPGYIEELYQWLRFSPSDPQWSQDGLNTEAMALSGLDAWGGSFVMKPKIFRGLVKIGLAKPLISEAAKIKSALGLWVIYAPGGASPIEMGRTFMREWLRMTQKSLFGAPLSVLTDEPSLQADLKILLGVPASARIVNILKAGPLPTTFKEFPRARIKASDLVIKNE